MSSIASLEAYRPVAVEGGSSVVEQIKEFGRRTLEVDGSSVVAIRPTNEVFRTSKVGTLHRPEDRLNYYHLALAEENVKHVGKKFNRARDRLENGARSGINDFIRTEDRCGLEPLEETFEYIMKQEFNVDPTEFIEANIDDIDVIEYQSKYPGKYLFVFKITDKSNVKIPKMLHRMSEVAQLAITKSGGTIRDFPVGGIVDSIPFAETNITCEKQRSDFVNHVRELLPLPVLFTSLELTTKY